jgi:hypothetical protein
MSVVFVVSLLIPTTLAAWNSSGTPTFSQPEGYQTKVYNVSAATTTLSYAYTDEELAMLWNQVGDIEVGPITTTVEPTPEPSAYPSPGVFHPLVRYPSISLFTSN